MKSKNYLVLLVIFLFALGGTAETGYAWQTYHSTTDPGNTDPGNTTTPPAPWKHSSQAITGLGAKLWVGVDNSYRQHKNKNLTINIGPTLTSLGATASKSYGYYANGSQTSTVYGPYLTPNSNPREYTISYDPQPDWEVIEFDIPLRSFQAVDMALADVDIEIQVAAVAFSHCAKTNAQDVTLTISEAAHEGPDDLILVREIWIFPEAAMVDMSVDPTFEAPEGSGTWQYEFTEVDPEGNGHENHGVRWYTEDGPGIEAQQEYSTTLTTIGHPGTWHSYFVLDDVSGEWQHFRLMAKGRVPTLSEWGLIVMVVLLLTAGTLMICRRRRVAA